MSNWYSRYYGDYMRDTSHLSLIEHGAYTVLLDHYYATRTPIKNSPEVLCRICRAFSEEERAAVDSVARQFFTDKDGFLHNNRADKELAKENVISRARSAAGAKGANSKLMANAVANAKANAVAIAVANAVANAKQLPGNCSSKQGGKTLAAATTTTTTTTNTITTTPTPTPKEDLFGGGGSVNHESGFNDNTPDDEETDKSAVMLEIESWYGRRRTTKWSKKEVKALGEIAETDGFPPDIATVKAYYTAKITPGKNEVDIRRRDLLTLLNNWNGEIDRARSFIVERRKIEPNFAEYIKL